MSFENAIGDYAWDLTRKFIARRYDETGDALAQLLYFCEDTEELNAEVASFKAVMMSVEQMTPDEIEAAVQKLASAARKAGPNGKARALLLD